MPSDSLLEDEWVIHFINHGWLNMRFAFPPGYHQGICQSLAQIAHNPGNRITDEVPELTQVVRHPGVQGVLQSLLGPNFEVHPHRHFYNNLPGSQSQGWHVDAATPDHMLRGLILFYYPQDVEVQMGPTILVPGTHFRDAPMDRLASYANLRGQKTFLGQAGTMAVLHPDLWHARSLNRSATPRYMIKFMLTRPDLPSTPTWRHNPDTAGALFLRKVRDFVGPIQSFCSDYLAEWEWRRRLWNWMRGAPPQAPNLMDFLV
jgi:hypothetical protein